MNLPKENQMVHEEDVIWTKYRPVTAEAMETEAPSCSYALQRVPGAIQLSDHKNGNDEVKAENPETESIAANAIAESENNVEDNVQESSGFDIPNIHPLLIPNVIREVMLHLSATDCEKFRLVCSIWNDEACKVIRTKRTVVFLEPEAVTVYNNAMKNTSSFPHAHFEFCLQDITGMIHEDLRDFWIKFGPAIKSLELRQAYLYWGDFFHVMDDKVPNLDTLSLRHLPRNMLRNQNFVLENHQVNSVKVLRLASLPSLHANAVDRLTSLLKALPNLEKIEFLPIKQKTVQTRISAILVDVLGRPDVILPRLKWINHSLELDADALNDICNKRYAFQKLQMVLENGANAASFHNLITSLRATLTELTIKLPDHFSNSSSFVNQHRMKPEECLQVLSNLKSLKISNLSGSLNFVQHLTSLEDFEFTTKNLARSIPFGFTTRYGSFSRFSCDHHLKKIKIIPSTSNSPPVAETVTLDAISRCFPYLTSLHISGVDDDGLGVIYRNLPFLSTVELLEAKCTDQGITGIPSEICEDMLETRTFLFVQAEKFRRDLFIGSLQYLSKLTILGSQMTDASCTLGIVDCKNLKELKIGSSMISDTGIIFITDRFCKQLDMLDITECTELTEQSSFYAKEKLNGKIRRSSSLEDATLQIRQSGGSASPLATNNDRKIVIPRNKGYNTASKFVARDTEFFEEMQGETFYDRLALPAAVPLNLLPPERADRLNRIRGIRIREAFRRNRGFMRNLQRLGAIQFRRMIERFVPGNVVEDAEPGLNNLPEAPAIEEPIPVQPILEEDDGAPIIPPGNLPEVHVAEILRLGLRLEDVEYWLRNPALFEREEVVVGNGRQHAVAIAMAHEARMFGGAGDMRLPEGFNFHDIFHGDDELIDMEDIRRVVFNAFGDEAPFGEEEG